MRRDDLVESAMAVEVKIIRASKQMHGKDQSHKPEVVITVEVRDQNVIDTMKVCLVPHQLHLCSFAAVDQEIAILNFDQLR